MEYNKIHEYKLGTIFKFEKQKKHWIKVEENALISLNHNGWMDIKGKEHYFGNIEQIYKFQEKMLIEKTNTNWVALMIHILNNHSSDFIENNYCKTYDINEDKIKELKEELFKVNSNIFSLSVNKGEIEEQIEKLERGE